MIVLADQNRRQIPERGDVKRLKQLPLIRRTVTVENKGHGFILGILLSEGNSTSERDLSPDDAMAAEKPGVFLVKVHRTTFSSGATGLAAHELGEHLEEGPAAAEEDAVVAIGGDNGVLLRNRRLHPNGDGLLAVVKVAKPSDQLRLVERVGGDLHPAHGGHVVEEGEELLGSGLDGARRLLALVGGEGDGGLDGEGGGVVSRGGGRDRASERVGGAEKGGCEWPQEIGAG